MKAVKSALPIGQTNRPISIRNVLIKGLGIFLLLNLLLGISGGAVPLVERVSLYNLVYPGRQRLPFGEDASRSYNLSLSSLDAMFASHILSAGAKPADEYRIIVIGDSSIWGTLLKPDETLAGVLDGKKMMCGSQTMRVYNLGFPTLALAKDYLILSKALQYQPDAILWSTTLEAFPKDKQLTSPQVSGNRKYTEQVFKQAGLDYRFEAPGGWFHQLYQDSLLGGRRDLADIFRLQVYGALWAATGIDQNYPLQYPPAQVDFDENVTFHGWQPQQLGDQQLALDILQAGIRLAGSRPVLLVNEPMLVSQGKNSHLRYNFYYPRWAYDQYRDLLSQQAREHGWWYLDLWQTIPPSEFTNSAIHLSPAGVQQFARQLEKPLVDKLCSK